MRSRSLNLCLALGAAALAGCSGRPAPPQTPRFDAATAGRAAIAMYDSDGDGKLDAAELERCPALKMALDRADTDGDGALSADEIAARINAWFGSGTVVMDGTTRVTLDGKPLVGAEVVFEPEECLGSGFKTCRGVTDQFGHAFVTGADPKYPGVYVGAYRVRISKIVDGRETILDRYNTRSELGYEVADDLPFAQGLIEFHLRSR
jgi:hypothetical protein